MADHTFSNQNLDAKSLWKAVLGDLQTVIRENDYKTWFAPTKAENLTETSIDIICPNVYIKERITAHNYRALIQESIDRIGTGTYTVNFVIGESTAKEIKTAPGAIGPLFEQNGMGKNGTAAHEKTGLSSKFTFENYLMGKNNQLAYAIATAIATDPGRVYNPVFVYSDVGLGKTHLIQALGNKILEKNPSFNVLYCTGENFTNELIESIQKGKGRTAEFRSKFRKLDALLIDDIQFIAGKESTQEEFFHTFNALHLAQKQVVLTSDRPPKDFKNIEARLTSRFGSGIIADIQQPDTDMRAAILRSKRDDAGDDVPNDVIDFIAEKITSNVRELKGAYLQVLTYTKTLGVDVTKETAARALGQSIKEEAQKPVNLNQILKSVCNYYSVKSADIKGPCRTKDLVVPRQVAMYLIQQLTGTPLMTIGEFLGGRDHTTVLHGIRKVEAEVRETSKLRQDISNLKQSIYSSPAAV